jgi:hypothetical protein
VAKQGVFAGGGAVMNVKPQIRYPFYDYALEGIKFPCEHGVISSEFVIDRYKFSGISDGGILSVKSSEKAVSVHV